MTEVEFYRSLFVHGLLAPQNPPAPPKVPGYKPDPVVSIQTSTGSQSSIESGLQILVAALANTFADQSMTDAEVMQRLTLEAARLSAYLEGKDPAASDIMGLVDKYVKVYRIAVTPIVPSSVPSTLPAFPPVIGEPPAPVTPSPTPSPVSSLVLVGSFKETNAQGKKVFNPGPGANDQTVKDGDTVSQGGLTFIASVVNGPLGIPEITFIQQ